MSCFFRQVSGLTRIRFVGFRQTIDKPDETTENSDGKTGNFVEPIARSYSHIAVHRIGEKRSDGAATFGASFGAVA
ncbi:hypothetical protein [Parapedobacter defluvii]|uniref:hypothetical protein n=1 Tax=Parapedobacter defluvii TaxID=2045106 RepID=UPI001666D7B2|nr:hypothetical protein [Parapedobacter defluvii]